MDRVISIHEYKLMDNATAEQFEAAVENARKQKLFELPGLVEYHFLKKIRGTKSVKYSAIWVYENRKVWEKLWGKVDSPTPKDNYPENWKVWEEELLAPLLTQGPDRIDFAAYEEF
jgi:hypothetical protein